jgi:hypothetical protein
MQLGVDPAGGEAPRQRGHLVGVPARRELAGVDEPQRPPRRGLGGRLQPVGQRHDRREQNALAGRLVQRSLQEAPAEFQ